MSTALAHEVLRDDPGSTACLLGNVAIARGALEAGVQLCTCYPGTPASEVGDTIARIAKDAGIRFEYSVNEKVAIEIAFAASLTGARTMSSMKHLGLNYAGDPLSTMPYVGVEGGMLIVSAGDPAAITSPNEQDQRHFSRFLFYPIFDPATPQDALSMTRYGFELSEKTRLPVILRPTTRVCHTSGMVEFGPLPETRRQINFTKNPPRHVPIPANARRMRQELIERYARAEDLLLQSEFFPRTGGGKHGIVASGVGYAYASQVIHDLEIADRVALLQIGAYPIPDRLLRDFLNSVESILVVEELTPFVEECVILAAFRGNSAIPIYGKGSGHFPTAGEYGPDLVEEAIRNYLQLEQRSRPTVSVPELPPRPPVLCPGCPHRTSFYFARKVFGEKTVYSSDIGCYTLGYGEPLASCDLLLCMGASISQASAIARTTGERTVAYLGDSTFFHSGLPALANAVQSNDEVTVIILNNYVTAMTGFQPSFVSASEGPHPGAGRNRSRPGSRADSPTRSRTSSRTDAVGDPVADAPPASGLSLEKAVRGLGVKEVYSVNQFDKESTLEALRRAKCGTGVNVVICNSPCVVHQKRVGRYTKRPPYRIDQDLCTQCSLCVRMLGCPAIQVAEEEYSIDQDLCEGCGLCLHVCKQHAIKR
jgi:indolepyruvate ferredoxin oxidoreductase alpha subunit